MEECREAYRQSQGMVLFGSKIRLTPLDTDGEFLNGIVNPRRMCKDYSSLCVCLCVLLSYMYKLHH